MDWMPRFIGLYLLCASIATAGDATGIPRIVAGTVVTPDGEPVPGLKVTAFLLDNTRGSDVQLQISGAFVPFEKQISDTTTDKNGEFRFEFSSTGQHGLLRIDRPEGPFATWKIFFPDTLLGQQPTGFWSDLRIRLPEYKPVEFRIVDSQRKPVVGATVYRAPPQYDRTPGPVFRLGETDEQGLFSDFTETELAPQFWVLKTGYLPSRLSISSRQGVVVRRGQSNDRLIDEPQPFELILTPSTTVTGRILDQSGVAVGGATVVLKISSTGYQKWMEERSSTPGIDVNYWTTYLTRTDDNGRFSLSGLRATEHILMTWSDSGMASKVITCQPGENNEAGDISLGAGTKTQGQLWDIEAGKPVENAKGKVGLSPFVVTDHGLRAFDTSSLTGDIRPDGTFEIEALEALDGKVTLVDTSVWIPYSKSIYQRQPLMKGKLFVRRRPDPVSDDEIPGLVAQLQGDFQLDNTQKVRRIDRPFPRSREAFFQAERIPDYEFPELVARPKALLMKARDFREGWSPNSAVWIVDDRGRIRLGGASYEHLSASEIISSAIPEQSYSFKNVMLQRVGNVDYTLPLNSKLVDFVVRQGISMPELIEGLNREFANDPKIEAQLAWEEKQSLALVVKNRPAPEFFSEQNRVRACPDGYEGLTEVIDIRTTWVKLIQNLARRAGVDWKLEIPDNGEVAQFFVEIPSVQISRNASTQEYREALNRQQVLIRESLPPAFRESLDVEMKVEMTSVPVITISPR